MKVVIIFEQRFIIHPLNLDYYLLVVIDNLRFPYSSFIIIINLESTNIAHFKLILNVHVICDVPL